MMLILTIKIQEIAISKLTIPTIIHMGSKRINM
jgi:hypothetical protein